MAKFDPDKDFSQIMGSSLRKWVQDGVYFDKNYEPILSTTKDQAMSSPVKLKKEAPKAKAMAPKEEPQSRVIGKVDND